MVGGEVPARQSLVCRGVRAICGNGGGLRLHVEMGEGSCPRVGVVGCLWAVSGVRGVSGRGEVGKGGGGLPEGSRPLLGGSWWWHSVVTWLGSHVHER